MAVTTGQISCENPGWVDVVPTTAGADYNFKGPRIPQCFLWIKIGIDRSNASLTYSPAESTYANGIVTCRLYGGDDVETFRVTPVYGVEATGEALW